MAYCLYPYSVLCFCSSVANCNWAVGFPAHAQIHQLVMDYLSGSVFASLSNGFISKVDVVNGGTLRVITKVGLICSPSSLVFVMACTAAANISYDWANVGVPARGMVVDAVGGSLFVATAPANFTLKRVTASPGMSLCQTNVIFEYDSANYIV